MIRKPRHTAEFRAALNKQIEESGYSTEEVARYLRVSAQVLSDWLQNSDYEDCLGHNAAIGSIRAELVRVKEELELAKEEREILGRIAELYTKN